MPQSKYFDGVLHLGLEAGSMGQGEPHQNIATVWEKVYESKRAAKAETRWSETSFETYNP
jgi:hypothetical protein